MSLAYLFGVSTPESSTITSPCCIRFAWLWLCRVSPCTEQMMGNDRSQPLAFATRRISATTSYSCFPGLAAAIAARYICRDTPMARSISSTSAVDLTFRWATTALCSGSERYEATIVGLRPSSAVSFSVCSAR